jgi:3-oxoadipate enol-lactonase
MVLLHPVGLRGAFWNGVVAELEGAFRLIVPDARGHGDSDAPARPFTLEDLADDVAELIRAVGQPPTILVGCSMGGMTAQALAVRAPELLAGVVIANTAHRRNDQGRATMEARAQAALQGMPATLKTTLTRWFDADVQALRPDLVLQARDWLLEADPVVHCWAWRAIRDLNHAEELGRLKIPALAIAGLHDQSTPVTAVKEMATAIPNCDYREMTTGHLAPFEAPAEFAAHLRDFARNLAAD